MKKIFAIILLSLMATPAYALNASDFSATTPKPTSNTTWFAGLGRGEFSTTLEHVIFWMLMIAGGLGFIALLVGAGQYLLAAGDQQKAVTAKKTITYSIIGIIIIITFITILEFLGGNLFKTPTTP